MDTMHSIEQIKESQKTVDLLLKLGSWSIREKDKTPVTPWQLEPVYVDAKCNMGIVHIKDTDAGPCKEHVHVDSKEYLIVISGKVMLNVNGKDVRVLDVGECGVINPGELHCSRPLENGTQMVYVCVPSDQGMENLNKILGVKECQKK